MDHTYTTSTFQNITAPILEHLLMHHILFPLNCIHFFRDEVNIFKCINKHSNLSTFFFSFFTTLEQMKWKKKKNSSVLIGYLNVGSWLFLHFKATAFGLWANLLPLTHKNKCIMGCIGARRSSTIYCQIFTVCTVLQK